MPLHLQMSCITVKGFAIMEAVPCKLGGMHLKLPKFEHIFVAIITFSLFRYSRYNCNQHVVYSACFKIICEISL